MSDSAYRFTRLLNDEKLRTTDLARVMQSDAIDQERWLFVAPHDDDVCVGGGIWMQAAIEAGVDVDLLVVTDGRMGYCSLHQKETIVETRHAETIESCAILGLGEKQIHFIDYPDCALSQYQGRRPAEPNEPQLHGHVGLQNAMTWNLRRFRPTRLLIPSPTDLHPDHRMTYSEMMICLFHAGGDIWPELGQKLNHLPAVYEMAVYCDFSSPPNLQAIADDDRFQKKLDSIAAFRSQVQIARIVQNVRDGGPVEYLRQVDFRFYNPAIYNSLFE